MPSWRTARLLPAMPVLLSAATVIVTVIVTVIDIAHAQTSRTLPTPQLGRPLRPAQVAAWDNNVFPDGAGLPAGDGSAAEGEALYRRHCIECHGPGGIGLTAPALAGASEPLDGEWPDQTIGSYWPYASTLFDFIRSAKPMAQPGTFEDGQVYALCAYLLQLNGLFAVTPDTASARLDAAALRAIEMPNRNGFLWIDAGPPAPSPIPNPPRD